MEAGNSFDILISTCDGYSDLWDANILLFNRNWADRRGQTFLVTDVPTEKEYENVRIIASGAGTEITERLAMAVENVRTKYILFTMDDYFLTKPIDSGKLCRAIDFMEKENIDYLRLYPATKHYLKREGAVQSGEYPGFYHRNIDKGEYKVSLYPGLWKTDFMRMTLSKPMSAWNYEVELTDMARRVNARCAISNNGEFPFLDVIRKGKILRKANRYFKKNPIYRSEREVMKAKDEFVIRFRTCLRHTLPRPIFEKIKRMMVSHGKKFYSPIPDKSKSYRE